MDIIRKIDESSLKYAKRLIENDELVAFPTETVYGLGGNAFSDKAIKAIYNAKKRPLDNPLIVHIHKDYDINELVYDNPLASAIKSAFCPGPITLVYNAKDKVSPLVSCGLKTLALRVPSSDLAQEFLRYVDIPISAPSANISKHTSPVTAEHVYKDFGSSIPLILDGGRCNGGIESTVVDVTGEIPIILRKGLITASDIKKVVGCCEYAKENSELNSRSPGTKYRHYTPQTQTAYFEFCNLDSAITLYKEYENQGKKPYFMCDGLVAEKLKGFNVYDLGSSGEVLANRLYYYLREGETEADIIIGIELTLNDEVTLSVKNRYLKAFAS